MEVSTPSSVYVWSERKYKFVRTDVRRLKCPNCGLQYGSRSYGEDNFWWDMDDNGDEYLCCTCGQEFHTTLEAALEVGY